MTQKYSAEKCRELALAVQGFFELFDAADAPAELVEKGRSQAALLAHTGGDSEVFGGDAEIDAFRLLDIIDALKTEQERRFGADSPRARACARLRALTHEALCQIDPER